MKISLLAILLLSANLLLIGCADDQARQQIADTNQRLSQIQQNVGVLDNKVSNQKILDILNQVNDLQTQINQLNGQIANLTESSNSSQANIDQHLQALDLRVQAVESTTGARPVIMHSQAAGATGQKSELQNAIHNIQANQITLAISELKQLTLSADKITAQNARYFLAVAYVANNQSLEAISEADRFIAQSPNNKYIPDAMRVVFIAQAQLGNNNAASATAKRLIRSYPKSEAAKKVAQQLSQ
jgi:TolA-binding protein